MGCLSEGGFRTLLIAGALVASALVASAPRSARATPAAAPAGIDIAVNKARVSQVWKTVRDKKGREVRGQGVLVGIVDSGIDYRNGDFKNPNGKTRIRFMWDQTGRGNPPAGFNFGNVCSRAAINNGSCSERDVEGHGTHVAGIAAGNGRSSNPPRYPGVANMADIGIVKIRGTSETDIVDACRYLIDKAKQVKEPLVINLSLGSERSPHDGSGPEARALNKLTGPGRIIVAAAGNESLRAGHASGTLRQGETTHLRFTTRDATDGTLHLYYPAGNTIAAELTDEATGQVFAAGPNGAGATYTSLDGTYRVGLQTVRYDAKWETFTGLIVATRRPVNGRFDLTLSGEKIAGSVRFNVWSGGYHIRFADPDRSSTLSTPADAQNLISVANYTTRVSYTDAAGQTITFCKLVECPNQDQRVGELDPSSSWGPTVDGRQKPDIAAPGGLIASTRSADVPTCRTSSEPDCVLPQLLINGSRNVVELGTSMASPLVAGVVALMLQVRPQLTAGKARQILRETARHDSFTGKAAWSPQWGAGKLDALAAVRKAKSLP